MGCCWRGKWPVPLRRHAHRSCRRRPDWFKSIRFHDTPAGLLLDAENGLFRYDGTRTVHVEGDPTGYIHPFRDTPGGLLLGAEMACSVTTARAPFMSKVIRLEDLSVSRHAGGLLLRGNGLFRYDGTRTVHVEGDPPGRIHQISRHAGWAASGRGERPVPLRRHAHRSCRRRPDWLRLMSFHDTPGGLLLNAGNGLFRYDGTRTVHVEGDPTGHLIFTTRRPGCCWTRNGLFRYDGTRTVHVEGDPTGYIFEFCDTPAGLFFAQRGLSLRRHADCIRQVVVLSIEIPNAEDAVSSSSAALDCNAHPGECFAA